MQSQALADVSIVDGGGEECTQAEVRSGEVKGLTQVRRIHHHRLVGFAMVGILPETAVPFEWLYAYSDEARRKQRAFIFGLEHFTINNFCFKPTAGNTRLVQGRRRC